MSHISLGIDVVLRIGIVTRVAAVDIVAVDGMVVHLMMVIFVDVFVVVVVMFVHIVRRKRKINIFQALTTNHTSQRINKTHHQWLDNNTHTTPGFPPEHEVNTR